MSNIAFGAITRFYDWAAGLPVTFSSHDSPKDLIKAVAKSAQKRSATSGVDVDDLFQAGLIAVWRAAEAFDQSRCEHFGHLSKCSAVNAMNSELRAEARHSMNRVWGDSTSDDSENGNEELLIEHLGNRACPKFCV